MRVTPITNNSKNNRAWDIKSTLAYAHYLIMKAQSCGSFMIDGHRASGEEADIAQECRLVSDSIGRQLAVCHVNDIPELIENYDILYRTGYNKAPDDGFIARHKCRLYDAWRAGDKSIDESKIFGMLATLAYSPEKKSYTEHLAALDEIREKWVRILVAHSYFPDATAYENYQRLAMVMRENLDKELGNKADEAKRRWYEHNRVENLSTLSSTILRSYRRFAGSLYPAVMDFDEKMTLDCKILEELSTRTDLDPYDREAFRLALAFNRHLADD